MTHKNEALTGSSESIIAALGRRLDETRLAQNLSQARLAELAGVSRSTLTRMADGQTISLDSFVRIMQALQLTDHLMALLPDPSIRPVDRVRQGTGNRQRASSPGQSPSQGDGWRWGDES